MLALHAGVRVHLALGVTDMRKGFDGLAAQVRTVLQADPFSGHLFLLRARRGDLLKALWWDGQGLVRRAAELGLQSMTLEAERLRVQIARLRHEQFGRSSERLAGEVVQLEMRLDEVLSDIAAAGANRCRKTCRAATSSTCLLRIVPARPAVARCARLARM
jgi:hypothetical protein